MFGERRGELLTWGSNNDGLPLDNRPTQAELPLDNRWQPESGRDYNTTDMSESRLRNVYLPPFKAAIDAGADTVMCSFNSINGAPGCANPFTETDILKDEWGFDGFIESDYTAVAELRACPGVNPARAACGHGVAEDGPDAAAQALNAGTDSEMVSTNYRDFGAALVPSAGSR